MKIGGKQYGVVPDQVITVDRLAGKVKDKLKLDQVLLIIKKDKLELGRPLVKGVVEAEIVEQFKDVKIKIAKFKAKSRYRKVGGHRQLKTKLKIVKI